MNCCRLMLMGFFCFHGLGGSANAEELILNPLTVYEFDKSNFAENGWMEPTGGFTGNPAGMGVMVNFTANEIPSSLDKKGLAFVVQPNEVAFIFALSAVNSPGKPVLMRLTVRANSPNAAVALGALRGNLYNGDWVDGSIATHVPASAQSFVNQERKLVLVYQPDAGSEITPLIQVAATGTDSAVTVWIDKLEIFSLESNAFMAESQAIYITPTAVPFIPTPTYSPTVPPADTPTSTPTPVIIGSGSPIVQSLSPTSGAWGDQVLLQGEGFGNDANAGSVYFGQKKAEILEWDNHRIVVVVPQGAYTGNIIVTVGDKTSDPMSFGVYYVDMGESIIYPEIGGRVITPDGAQIIVAPQSSEEEMQIDFEQLQEASGQYVSGEYAIHVISRAPVYTEVWVTLPLATKLLPAGFDAGADWGRLTPEYYDSASNTWIPFGTYLFYDPNAHTFSFFVSLRIEIPTEIKTGKTASPASLPLGSIHPQLTDTDLEMEAKFRISLPSGKPTAVYERPGSDFRFHYVPDNVKPDSQWDAVGSHSYSDPATPNYIEDMDKAMNLALKGLVLLPTSTGETVFADPTKGLFWNSRMDVYVEDLGMDDGDTSMKGWFGTLAKTVRWQGTIRIHQTRMQDWTYMKTTAGHELTHLLQGDYYYLSGTFAPLNNKWFVEASANYFGTQAFDIYDQEKLSTDVKIRYWSDDLAAPKSVYLSEPLGVSDDTSYYAAAHFFYWLEHNPYPGVPIIADAFQIGSGNDMLNLVRAIPQNGKLGELFTEYALEIIKSPTVEFSRNVKTSMDNHICQFIKPVEAQGGALGKSTTTYAKVTKKLGYLTTAYIKFGAWNDKKGMLVMDYSKSIGEERGIKRYTYMPVPKAEDYAKIRPDVVTGLKNSWAETHPYGKNEVNNGFEQLIVYQAGMSPAIMIAEFYILLPPENISISEGSISWSTSHLGNIPADKIAGYNVYRIPSYQIGQDFGQLLNPTPIPYSPGSMICSNSYITATDQALVTVVDKIGNEWPKSPGRVQLP